MMQDEFATGEDSAVPQYCHEISCKLRTVQSRTEGFIHPPALTSAIMECWRDSHHRVATAWQQPSNNPGATHKRV